MDASKTNSILGRHRVSARNAANPNSTVSRGNRFQQDRFEKSLLPMPIAVLHRLGIKPGPANRSGYWLVKCPLHKKGKEQHPSFSIHQVNGNFRCFACGAHGGDVLSLWMQYTGKPFKQAAKELGAWRLKP
jgi:hypothetical protein